jgi:chromosome segregation ATPase
MSRPGVTYQTIKQTANKLLSQGVAPSVQKIRELLGTGSNSTIATHLKLWREEYAQKNIHHLPASMPEELIASIEVLWQTAMEHAEKQLSAHKQSLDDSHSVIQQAQQEAEKAVLEMKEKLAEISDRLEKETTEKQALITELAVMGERLKKKDEALTSQKEENEIRLKRVYEEKENIITQNQHFQSELKKSQEKITTQTEQHQKLLSQQNEQQSQSENRWLKLIDQANQETKDANKKIERLRNERDEQLKKFNDKLSDMQKNLYEKNMELVELKVALEEINPLKNDIKNMEKYNMKSKNLIMKLWCGRKREKMIVDMESHQK